ncbi:MAG: helix-turn-helix domain-containing protein [Planctomycetota bacterium]|jgi:AraC-like DNA-binding protein
MGRYSVQLKIPRQKITGTTSEQVAADNPLAREVAGPLFDAAVDLAALTGRKAYSSGPPQCFPHHELMVVLQGTMAVRFGGRSYTQKPGMLSFCPSNEPFARRNKVSPTWWLYFKLFDRPIWEPLKRSGGYIREYESTDYMLLLLSRILDAHRTREVQAKLEALEDSRALVALLKRELRYVGKKPHPRSADLARVASMVQRSPEKPWTLQSMALEAHMAPRTLSRLFQEEYGGSPMNLVIQHRLNKAAAILTEADDTIAVVAEKSGYRSVYSFSNLFLRHFGVRPGRYREVWLAGRTPGHAAGP